MFNLTSHHDILSQKFQNLISVFNVSHNKSPGFWPLHFNSKCHLNPLFSPSDSNN